jgi:lipoprotein-releasing system permease protein
VKLALSIALSHLLSHPRQTVVSLLGIVLGVAFFLAVSAMMQGSENDFMQRLVNNSPHVTVYDEYRNPQVQPATQAFPLAAVDIRGVKPRSEPRGIRQYKQKQAFIAGLPGVRVAPVLEGQAILTFASKDIGASVTGVDPALMKTVSSIDQYFVSGSLDSLSANANGILIGTGLADKFRVQMGNNLTVTSPAGVVRTMKIVGLFRTGNANYDASQTFVQMGRAQSMLDRPNIANRFIIKLADPATAPAVAAVIEGNIGYKAQSWQESSQDIMSLMKTRNVIMYSVVAAILVVASFGIYNVISTVVLEKTRDIAIMKSMGFHARDIRLIFLIEGGILGILGSIAGTGMGMLLMKGLEQISFKTPFYTDATHLPIYWGWDQMALAAGFAMGSALLAAYLPARKGGRVQPVDILRGAA